MKIEYQIGLIVLGWFLVAVINGIRDMYRDYFELPWWKRPALLLFCWIYGAVSAGLALGGQWLINSAESVASFGLLLGGLGICAFLIGIAGIIGGIGCSFIIPWVDSMELDFP